MTSPQEEEPATANRWAVRARTTPSASDAPPAEDILDEELTRIERRIDDVITQGRAEFTEGSDSYDRATVAILRLAALFECDERFGELLRVVTLAGRCGLARLRRPLTRRPRRTFSTRSSHASNAGSTTSSPRDAPSSPRDPTPTTGQRSRSSGSLHCSRAMNGSVSSFASSRSKSVA